MTTVSIDLIDVCLGCYLADHHNRKGELLLGVPVDNTTTQGEIKEQLLSEINAADYGLPKWFSYDKYRQAVGALFSSDKATFDSSLDPPESDEWMMDEPCQAWFLITYSRR